MHIALRKIFHQFSGKTNLEDTRIELLFEAAENEPYFAPAQFFLALKMKSENHSNLSAQLNKTALYFNNIHWLHYQLVPKPELIEFIEKEKTETTQPILQNVIQEDIKNLNSQIKEDVNSEKVEDAVVKNNIPLEAEITEAIIEKPIEFEKEKTDFVPKENQSITALVLSNLDNEEVLNPIQTIHTKNDVPMLDTNETDLNEDVQNEPDKTNRTEVELENKLSTILKEQLEEYQQPVTKESELQFEQSPHHTVDYFESQGIKAEINLNSNDKLSTQLKKFTDWLKHMKNLNLEQEKDLGTDPELENAIQGIAQNSNEAREIVTETMAEVLEKQGKKDKAIQLYIKLSFLNPDKSSYFAAKIQHLKGI
ncbi:MAG: hypothetical protein IT251_06210 [Chitinophagaceae bacterium]|nr:hypothetical protein [Chitinophagaceae bacterium]MCC6635077.1 hypothetical protein [Chitinophagaceae bacterium]